MDIGRRSFLGRTGLLLSAGAVGAKAGLGKAVRQSQAGAGGFRRIAVEEAWAIPEQIAAMKEIASRGQDDADLDFWRTLLGKNEFGERISARLLDLDGERLRIMDGNGVSMHLLLLTSCGVQMLDADRGTAIASLANDRLAEAIRRHPTRYAGLGVVAPQDPKRAVQELERLMTRLHLNGIVINSHTNGEYLDEPKYRPILEAAAALNAPIYIHPRAPLPSMAAPYRKYRLEGAIWGYQADTGLHGIRLIVSGVFDSYPNLKIVLGHMGEAIPYWLWRVDYMHTNSATDSRPKLKQRPSDYFKRNFAITTSGMNHAPVLQFCIGELSADNIMFAIDYPYQDMADSVRFMNEAPISRADKEKIYHGNAERIFGIKTA